MSNIESQASAAAYSSSFYYEDLEASLKLLYEEANELLDYSTDAELMKPLLAQINSKYSEMEILVSQETDESLQEIFQRKMTIQHQIKGRFDLRVTQWLKNVRTSANELFSVVSAPRTLRSSTRLSKVSSTSSIIKAKAAAKQQAAQLRLKQLKQLHKLRQTEADRKRAREREEAEVKDRIELLEASHEIERCSIERQVLEEELDRGGYLSDEEQSNAFHPTSSNKVSRDVKFNLHFSDTNAPIVDVKNPAGERASNEIIRPRSTLEREDVGVNVESSNRGPEIGESDRNQIPTRTQPTTSSSPGSVDFIRSVSSLIRQSIHRPSLELIKFSGDPTKFPRFMTMFESTVDCDDLDDQKKLLYLIQQCEGKAKELIEYCLLLDPTEGYAKAKACLKDNYGRKNAIARAYVNRLTEGPKIKFDDSKSLIKLSQDVEECQVTLSHLNYSSNLNNFANMAKIVARLPTSTQTRWLRKAAALERQSADPSFLDLVSFLKEEAEVVKSSYASVLNAGKKTPSKFSTNAAIVTNKPKQNKETCSLCSANHLIFNCSRFKEKSLTDKMAFMRRNRLCDNCGKQGHIAKFCFKPNACTISTCEFKHHSLLHRTIERTNRQVETTHQPVASADVATTSSTSFTGQIRGNNNVYLNVVPIKVVASGTSVYTYAFLDQGSTTSLCDKRLLDKLGVEGEEVSFSLSTVGNALSHRKGNKVNLVVSSPNGENEIDINGVLSIDKLPVHPNSALTPRELNTWPHLRDVPFQAVDEDVLLLIGVNIPEAFFVYEERRGKLGEPYAVKTTLGWSLVGPCLSRETCGSDHENYLINFVSETLDHQVERLWKIDDVPSKYVGDKCFSKSDRYALHLMKQSKEFENGHYSVALPWCPGKPQLPDNRSQAGIRLAHLKRRLQRNPELKRMYVTTMNSYISKGDAALVKDTSTPGWYLPHHPVQHARKPEKVRVVFDCAARYYGTSLNDQLLKGPDLLNNLVGVLTRFRKERLAFMGDIECMFHQVNVSPVDYDFLRFFWWKNGDLMDEPQTYNMKVHLFGATSSPSCTQFCLQEAANEQEVDFNSSLIDVVRNNFYMDDCLFSVAKREEAIDVLQDLTKLLRNRGFNIKKWLGNDKKVLDSIPNADLSKVLLNLPSSGETSEKVLGVQWDFLTDCFKISITFKDKPMTRRGILSTVCSLFDPLGFTSPVILKARLLLQDLCRRKLTWDQEISDRDRVVWSKWLFELNALEKVCIPRCLLPAGMDYSKAPDIQVHHFSDASQNAYAVVSYIRFVNDCGEVSCTFLFGKSRLAPIKSVTIPRLELVAATLAVKIDAFVKHELSCAFKSYFWTDSLAVLHMIHNTSKRFPVFVANRLSKIEQGSEPNQWNYVPTKHNPADEATRGMNACDLTSDCRWLVGPEFLKDSRSEWPCAPCTFPSLPEEFEVLKHHSNAVRLERDQSVPVSMEERFSRFSSWHRLKKSIAWLIRLKDKLVKRSVATEEAITVTEMRNSETVITKIIQQAHFGKEIASLKNTQNVRYVMKRSSLRTLNPVLTDEILRVGGRLRKAPFTYDVKFPVILPSSCHVTRLIIEDHHSQAGHLGMSYTWTSLRQRYWVIRGAATVRKVLGKCLICRRRNARLGQQFMADLPVGRIAPNNPPFHFTGLDFFGPYWIKQRRVNIKRYGCIFTCLTTRAVHIEMSYDLTADAFINVFRRFTGRRGIPHVVYSDNGTNLVGGYEELRRSLKEWNVSKIGEHMLQRNVKWIFNPPHASHMGGIWERVIRSIRRILDVLLRMQSINDDTLSTFFVEVESIINCRPLTPITQDPDGEEPLTPNHLLLLRGSPNYSPGIFNKGDNFIRKRWRQVQFLADQFWQRWRREYIHTLQTRQKWQSELPNFKVDDVVLISDNSVPRGSWPLGRIIELFPDDQGLVRQVLVRTARSTFKRPISKLCRLIENID